MSSQPEVTVRDNPVQTRYEVLVDGTVAGFTRYELSSGHITFIHTEVDQGYAGRGLAGTLATSALDDVRARGLAVIPQCPYIRGFLGKNPAYADLVPPERRSEFGLQPPEA